MKVLRIAALALLSAFCFLTSAFPQSDDFARSVYFGRKFFDLRDYVSAYDQFAKANALQPDQAGVLYDMALVLAKAGRFGEAQKNVDRYNAFYPNGAEKPLVQKLQLELDFQRELEKKHQADDEYLELFARAKFLYAKNDLDAALKLFQQAEEQHPGDAAAIFNEARIYERLGEYQKASERYKRYDDIEPDPARKADADQRILALDATIDDMRTKIVCAFCGYRLPAGALWCPRCWHGPYLASPVCATATRAMFYSDGRFAKNDLLPCFAHALSYSPARQKAIQDARKAEGWRYAGEIIQSLGDQVRFEQGASYLEKAVDVVTGDALKYEAHKSGDGLWLLDREDVLIDGQKYTSRYAFDANNRVVKQQVEYQNAAACNHIIDMTADYTYANGALAAVKIHGGYDGYVVEGTPHVEWDAAVAYAYDATARLAREDLTLTSMTKTYQTKPYGAARDEVSKVYPTMRVRRPIESMLRGGDICATSGDTIVRNDVDLRAFYLMPDVAMVLPGGVTRATVTMTY